jgi:hypothetical protein
LHQIQHASPAAYCKQPALATPTFLGANATRDIAAVARPVRENREAGVADPPKPMIAFCHGDPSSPIRGLSGQRASEELQMGLLLIIVIFLLLFGGGYHGYRREYYGTGGFGIIGVILVVLLILMLFGGPRMGWHYY